MEVGLLDRDYRSYEPPKRKIASKSICELYTHIKAFRSLLFFATTAFKKLTHFLKSKNFMAETTSQFANGFACDIIQDQLPQFQDRFSEFDSRAEEVGPIWS